jgi:hypothetical protein
LVLALVSPPNTYDSQTYHLPRIEQWAQRGSVDFFPTAIRRQITYPPGAEYLLLHLRLLTGTDALYNLLQWSAGLMCLVMVARLAAQLDVSRRGQLLAALVVGSVPMVVLQSSSTQTDLVVAAWVTCVATFVLDGVGRTPARLPGPGTMLLLGTATGLVAVTKATGGLVAGPLLVWWMLAQLRHGWRATSLARLTGATLLIVVIAGALAGPQVARTHATFGHPLGPPDMRETLMIQRHDPASMLINALRQAHTAFEIPLPPVNRWAADRIIDLARALGRDPSDPRTTFYQQTFPDESWYPHEDKAALPLHGLLILIGAAAALRREDRRWLAYVAVLAVGVCVYAAAFRWQPWGNRLVLFAVVPGGVLAGAWLDRALGPARARNAGAVGAGAVGAGAVGVGTVGAVGTAGVRGRARGAARVVVVSAVAVAALGGLLSTAYGYPRRLLGSDSALVRDDWSARFAIRPEWADSYRRAGAAVNASGAERIGVASGFDNWEYPWYLMFPGKNLVGMQSPQPDKIPATPPGNIDALVCAGPVWHCVRYVPPGWVFREDGIVSWALPPS